MKEDSYRDCSFQSPCSEMDFVEGKEKAMPNFEMKDGVEIQHVWRTLSENKNSTGGFYVWDIMEYMSNDTPASYILDQFIQCRDGSWVMIQCYHSWTRDQAEKTVSAKGAFYQEVIIIPEMVQIETPDETHASDCGFMYGQGESCVCK